MNLNSLKAFVAIGFGIIAGLNGFIAVYLLTNGDWLWVFMAATTLLSMALPSIAAYVYTKSGGSSDTADVSKPPSSEDDDHVDTNWSDWEPEYEDIDDWKDKDR